MPISDHCWQSMYADAKYRWFWPPAYDPAAEPRELAFILSQIGARPDARLLDLGCGLGWLTIPLALQGFEVTGLDLSATLLERAADAAKQAKASIEWVCCDMRRLPQPWTGKFDILTFTLSEFGCFSDQRQNQAVLEEAARVLKPRGLFLIDVVVNRDGLVHQPEIRDWLRGEGFFVTVHSRLDLLSGIQRRDYQWYEQGSLHEAHWQIHTYTPPQMSRMLEQSGFEVLKVYGDLLGRELTAHSRAMTFLARNHTDSANPGDQTPTTPQESERRG